MKISKLYSNIDGFKKLVFKDGLNVILGGVFEASESNLNITQHDVGKSLALELIDFCLSGSIKPTSSLEKIKDDLQEYIFFLELTIKNGEYLTLARTFSEYKNIYYKITDEAIEFTNLEAFHKLNKSDLNSYLTKYINSDSDENFDFRSMTKRFFRTTDKYIDSFNKDDIFSRADINWLPCTLNSFGYGYSSAHDYILSFSKMDALDKDLTKAKEFYGFKKNTKKDAIEKRLDELKKQLKEKKEELLKITEKVNNFNLYKISDEQINTLVKDVDSKISKLNNRKYFLTKRLNVFRKSKEIKTDSAFHSKIENVFKEAGVVFTNQLVKSYDDLIEFNKQITLERNNIINQQIDEYTKELISVNNELVLLEQSKENLLEKIVSPDSEVKYLAAREELEAKNIEFAKESLEEENVQLMCGMIEEEKELKKKIKKYAEEYRRLVDDNNGIAFKCNETLRCVSKNILEKEVCVTFGLFNNSKPNIHITNLGDEKDKAGETVSTVKSIIYDIALLESYEGKVLADIPKYIIHDSPLADLGQYEVNLFTFLVDSFKDSNNQYIFTAYTKQIYQRPEIKKLIEDLINQGNINIVASLYTSEEDYTNALFGKKI